MTLPVDQLYLTTVVVPDARLAALEYANFYGITRWQVRRHGAFIEANGTNPVGGLIFRLVQPLGDGGFFELRPARRPGVHSICVTRVSRDELPSLQEWFAGLGAPVAHKEAPADGVEVTFFDMRALLGGFYLQVVASERRDWQAAATASEEVWSLGDEVTRPHALDFVSETRGLNHFGVIVPDLQEVLTNYVRVFGLERWRGYHWHTGAGSLEETTYMGQATDHAFSTARGDVGRDRFGKGFGFEIVQPVQGPTHFQDFLDAGGAGIHHLSLNLAMKDAVEWTEFQRWMATLGPVAMQGWLRDHAALYIYSDLSARIGHVVESGIRRRSGHEPDLWYDFRQEGPST